MKAAGLVDTLERQGPVHRVRAHERSVREAARRNRRRVCSSPRTARSSWRSSPTTSCPARVESDAAMKLDRSRVGPGRQDSAEGGRRRADRRRRQGGEGRPAVRQRRDPRDRRGADAARRRSRRRRRPTIVDDGRWATRTSHAGRRREGRRPGRNSQGEGPFTVFAPTNEAFAKLPEGTPSPSLLKPESKKQLDRRCSPTTSCPAR